MFKENTEPQINKETKTDKSDKGILWENKAQEIKEMTDGLGYGMDKGVEETVIALQLLGINVEQSCDGHGEDKHGASTPWIEISAPNQPEERLVGEKKIFEQVAKKYGLTVEEITSGDHEEAEKEVHKHLSQQEETDEFKDWEKGNSPLRAKTEKLLGEFYQNRDVFESERLIIHEMLEGNFKIMSNWEDYYLAKERWEEMDEKEKQALRERLARHQEEMKTFGKFLRDKFFS